MVPTLTLITFVSIIGFYLIYEYAEKRSELQIAHEAGAANRKAILLMQDGNERFDKKDETK